MRRKLNWKKRLLFALLPVLLILGSLELGFRLSSHSTSVSVKPKPGFIPDAELGWRLNPEHVETNELGLRDGPYRADAEKKVLLLGDSVSLGLFLPINANFASLAESALQEGDPERVYEIVNSGISGFSTFQELRYLRLRGLKLRPDVVVVQFCLNDVVERYHTLAEYGGGNVFMGVDTRRHAQGLYGWFVRNSVAFEVLSRALQRRAVAREEYIVDNLAKDSLKEPLERAWSRALDELAGIQRICKEAGIPLLVLVTPYKFQLADPEGLRQPQDRILAWGKAQGVPVVDLLPSFAKAKSQRLFRDGNHFAEEGHQLAARELIDPLRAMLR